MSCNEIDTTIDNVVITDERTGEVIGILPTDMLQREKDDNLDQFVLLNKILIELKRMNVYMSKIVDESVNNDEINDSF